MNPDYHEKDFSGDETGHIFTAADETSELFSSAERTVDTQSGFVVNIKNIDGRISLSVKRRIGTPPTSSVVFTPDESLKLSKILALSSNDELSGLSSYYEAANLRLNARSRRVGNLIRTIPGLRLNRFWSLIFLLAAAAAGYFVHPFLGSLLKSH